MKHVVLFSIALSLLLFPGSGSAARKTVLIIHSYHASLPWVQQYSSGIADVLSSESDIKHVYLDTKRTLEGQFGTRADEAWDAYDRLQPDVVMTADDNALRLVGPRIAATGTPVVFFGINGNPRDYFTTIPPNVLGLLERVAVFPWIRLLAEIIPPSQRALILMDASPTSKGIVSSSFNDRKWIDITGVRTEYRVAASWSDWQQIVNNITGYDFVTIPVYHTLKDRSGNHVPVDDVVRWTSEHCPVPVFAYQDYAVGDDGVVGAYVVHGEQHGRHAALIVKALLEGKQPKASIASMHQSGKFYFNKKQLARFGLHLPEEILQQAIFQ